MGAENLRPPGAARVGAARVGGTPPTADPATGWPTQEPEPENRFDVDFNGGSPRQFVHAIETAAKIPLNVIVAEEHEGLLLSPLKMRNVTVPQLFEAVTLASRKVELRRTGPNAFQQATTSYGFRSADQKPRANSIWYFFVEAPPPPIYTPPEPQCRFWQLEPYLEKLKVEDITTAVEAGWKMMGVNPLPKLSFHKDTKLLIVVGHPNQLSIVDDVLRELTPARKGPKDNPGQNTPAAGEKSSR